MKTTITLLSVLSLSISACGMEQPADTFSLSDEHLRPIAGEFLAECRAQGDEGMKAACLNPAPMTVKLVDSLPHGVKSASYQNGEIHVKKSLTGYELKKTIFHEIAHHMFAVESVTGAEKCKEIMFSGESCINSDSEWSASVSRFFRGN